MGTNRICRNQRYSSELTVLVGISGIGRKEFPTPSRSGRIDTAVLSLPDIAPIETVPALESMLPLLKTGRTRFQGSSSKATGYGTYRR